LTVIRLWTKKSTYEIEHYLTPGEYKDLYVDWLRPEAIPLSHSC